MARLGFGTSLCVTLALALLAPGRVFAQGQAMEKIKINLPPSPNFDIQTAPVSYPTGELSVFGLRKGMSKYLDKDVRVKGYLLEVYECPAEIRKCNDDAAAKAKKAARKAPRGAQPPAPAEQGACRPCDQPHFFISDANPAEKKDIKRERALLVADYPVKDWKTGKPKPLNVKVGEQYTVSGTFSINSMTGFGASNGLIIHKKLEDAQGAVVAEGNSVVPPDEQAAEMEGVKAPPAKK